MHLDRPAGPDRVEQGPEDGHGEGKAAFVAASTGPGRSVGMERAAAVDGPRPASRTRGQSFGPIISSGRTTRSKVSPST